jgi:hypothetical protein
VNSDVAVTKSRFHYRQGSATVDGVDMALPVLFAAATAGLLAFRSQQQAVSQPEPSDVRVSCEAQLEAFIGNATPSVMRSLPRHQMKAAAL